MSMRKVFGIAFAGALAAVANSGAEASPITSITPLTSNGTQMYAVYVFSEAWDSLALSQAGPNSVPNIFCNVSVSGCSQSQIGDIVDLGIVDPGVVFSLTDFTVPNVYRTDQLGPDGYSHAMVSDTVLANDYAAVAAAYSIFGQGPLGSAAASAIALLGAVPETSITFVGWEDRVGGDFDYNDIIFAFTDPPAGRVAEPETIAMMGFGLLGFLALRRRKAKA